MTSTATFQPDWASPPGATIRRLLSKRGKSVSDLPKLLNLQSEDIDAILAGRASITLALARALHETLGPSVQFWMARDLQYREDSARLQPEDRAWLNSLPIRDMIRFGWIDSVPPSQETATCLRFFGVPSVDAWERTYAGLRETAFRTTRTFSNEVSPTAAWLRRGEIEAAAIDSGEWNPDAFASRLSDARALTRVKDPAVFVKRLQDLFSECGVAVVIVRAPSGCRASGATRFASSTHAIIQLSMRYLADDQFWFSFFHEAAHLLLHTRRSLLDDQSNRGWFVELDGMGHSPAEREANDFAARILIPDEYREELKGLPQRAEAIIEFAHRVRIAPGVIVGQMQHLGLVDHSRFNRLKRHYTWEA